MRLIDADALKKAVGEFPNCYNGWSDAYDKSFIIGAIEEQPSIEPKRGEWVSKDPYWHTAICSNCNKVTMFEEWDEKVIEYDFCPNCGARMKGADDE